MTIKQTALNLIDDFYIGLDLKNYIKAKECAIYLAHSHIRETLDIEKIRYWKQIVIELEKL